jgi:hypothetical protein
MQPRRYTELFFTDEAVALAAGHRPCAECRHRSYQDFRAAWAAGLGLSHPPGADSIDAVLHSERSLTGGVRMTHQAQLDDLPDGAFIVWRDGYWLVHSGSLHLWTPGGYSARADFFAGAAEVLTPLSTVAVFGLATVRSLRPSRPPPGCCARPSARPRGVVHGRVGTVGRAFAVRLRGPGVVPVRCEGFRCLPARSSSCPGPDGPS